MARRDATTLQSLVPSARLGMLSSILEELSGRPGYDESMNPLLLIIILLLLFGGGGFYFGGPAYGGGGLGLILLICLIVYLLGGFRRR